MILTSNKQYERNTIEIAKQQVEIFEQNLSLRISLQQITDKINELPVLSSSSSSSLSSSFSDLSEFKNNELKDTLKDILKDTSNLLIKQIQHKKKKNFQEFSNCPTWNELIEVQNQLEIEWEEIINKWHARTHYGSEKNKANLKVFNQTIWDQVFPFFPLFPISFFLSILIISKFQIDEILKDDTRVIEKSRIPKRESKRRRLSIDQSTTDENENEDQNENINNNYDPEVYDDRAFYSLLLKVFKLFYYFILYYYFLNILLQSFISNSSNSANTSSHTLMRPEDLAALKSYKKSQSKVDRKASKGRKIKYVAHEKLKNFMFPIPTYAVGRTSSNIISASTTPTTNFFTEKEDIDRLYKSLFQQSQ